VSNCSAEVVECGGDGVQEHEGLRRGKITFKACHGDNSGQIYYRAADDKENRAG